MSIIKNSAFPFLLALLFIFGAGCSSEKGKETTAEQIETPSTTTEEAPAASASEPTTGPGVGPVQSVALGEEIDEALVKKGQSIFDSKCIICHTIDSKMIGPALAGVTKRRSPEWIMNMVINPQEMTAKDPVAKALLEEYKTPMVNQNVTEEDARALLEFFRSKDKS